MIYLKPVEISTLLLQETKIMKNEKKSNQNLFLENGNYNIKNLGTVHTPISIVRHILGLIEYSPEQFEEKYIIDLASGTGSFIYEIVTLLHKHLIDLGYNQSDYNDAKEMIEKISKHVYSFDINTISTLITLKRYLSVIIDEIELIREYEPNYLPHLNVYKENSLLEAFNLNLKFDYIVSNPPYVRYNEIDNQLKKAYKGLYETSRGKYDLYSLFFELGIKLLKNNGKLGYITPNRYFSTNYAQPLRSLILSKTKILKLVDLEETKPFYNVNAYPVITILSRELLDSNEKNNFYYTKIEEISNTLKEEFNPIKIQKILVEQRELTSDYWKFTPDSISSLKREIDNKLPKISHLPITIKAGIATGCDEIFILSGDYLDIEDELLIPIIRGRDISKGFINWKRTYLLNPYLKEGTPININEYPLAKKYMGVNKEKLIRRYHVKKGKKWYETHDSINLKKRLRKRIVGPDIADTCRFAIENGDYLCHNSCYSFYYDGDLFVLGAIMNSKFFEFILKSSLPKIGSGYWRQMKKNLKSLPIIDPETFLSTEKNQIRNLYENGKWDEIDEIIFNKIGLNQNEINIIHNFLNDLTFD